MPSKIGIPPALRSEIDRRRYGVERDRFHAGVGECDGGIRRHRDPQRPQGVLESHHAESYRAMPQVRTTRLGYGIEIDVDDVVEHPHRRRHGAFQPDVVQCAVLDVVEKIHGPEIANRDPFVPCVKAACPLKAQSYAEYDSSTPKDVAGR
jgi:hypothetical protein